MKRTIKKEWNKKEILEILRKALDLPEDAIIEFGLTWDWDVVGVKAKYRVEDGVEAPDNFVKRAAEGRDLVG